MRSLCSDRKPHFCSWECEHFRSRQPRRSIYFVDNLLQFSTGKLQVAKPNSFSSLVLFLSVHVGFRSMFVLLIAAFHVAGPFSTRAELAGFLCNTYLRRCDIVGGGNPDCFGIKTNSSEIHRCCSNQGQGQPQDGCFAEWPKGAKPATFDVCCTPGIRYGCTAFFIF